MTRIDDARAAKLIEFLTAPAMMRGISFLGAALTDALADRGAYKARIEELEKAIRTFVDALDIADRIIERALGTDVPKEWHRSYKACAKARSKLPTPSPTASDTRGLAADKFFNELHKLNPKEWEISVARSVPELAAASETECKLVDAALSDKGRSDQ